MTQLKAERDRSRGQEIQTILANMVKPVSAKNTKICWARWCTPVVPDSWEAEAGELLEPRRRRLQIQRVYYEKQLFVETTDANGKTLEGPVPLEVIVIDQNDNRPIFREGPYIGHVMEGSPTDEKTERQRGLGTCQRYMAGGGDTISVSVSGSKVWSVVAHSVDKRLPLLPQFSANFDQIYTGIWLKRLVHFCPQPCVSHKKPKSRQGTVAHACNPRTWGGRGGQITRSGVQVPSGQHGETLSLLKIQKLAGRGCVYL
ncbi:Cadherin-13 [Plecturocebus cupreus]